MQGLIGLGGNARVVGHHDEGLAEAGSAGGKKGQNLLPGLLVQIACGLIHNDELRLGQDGSGNAPRSLL